MHRPHHALSLVLATVAANTTAAAQELRRALVDADVVAVARQVGKTAFSAEVDLHRLQIVDAVRGVRAGVTSVIAIDWPHLSLHNRPSPRQSRLYCLHDATREAQRIGLPADGGPYYRCNARPGSNPLVSADLDADPIVRFARVLAAADRGVSPDTTVAALAVMALGDDAVVRLEATRHFAERPLLRTHLTTVQWSRMLGRTSAETSDVDYKIALAELCAEQRLDGVVEALVVGLGPVHDVAYARAVGRLCANLLGDEASQPLMQRLQTTADKDTRAALVLAIGATQTGAALDALLQLKQASKADAAAEASVDAALREHGSQKARDAVLRGKADGKEAK